MRRNSKEDYEFLFKVIITGDTHSGKSKILERFTYNSFGESANSATIGVEFVSKLLEINEGHSRVRLQLWDTAGSERYRAMTLSHYRNAVGAILVYDVSNEESFHNLEYWLKELRQKLDPYALIALCANKCDIMLTSPEKREVMNEMGKKFAR